MAKKKSSGAVKRSLEAAKNARKNNGGKKGDGGG